ncbi:molybdopterin-binding protein [Peptoniphilus catoniae]|uniref:molybdopterin-binding protein n=1 Tax=Peptoniphilus catoniae TaxID=1660341 RepID=UPI0010FDADA6|nr:molybdopterin-binding protein [Peptoniphilus catoniae]
MKKIRVEDAVGKSLCHDLTAIISGGFKGVKFKRGHIIEEKDIEEMKNMGKYHVYVWEDNVEEVHEDDASSLVVEPSLGRNVYTEGPREGKISVKASCKGMYSLNEKALVEINKLPDYTFASIRNKSSVIKDQPLCGARIVPLVTEKKNFEAAVKIAEKYKPIFEVKPFYKLKSKILITGQEIYDGRIKDAFEPILKKKLEYYDSEYLGYVVCPDDEDFILREINKAIKEGVELILITGGMSVDPDDVTPSAIKNSGADLICQGVPMQPGNMLTIAKLNKTTIIGVPGASMHSKITSLDFFLPRIFAKDEIKKEEIAFYGLDGLL